MNLKVIPVTSKQHWRDFFNVRRVVYRNDPSVVFPLRSMERMQLDQEKHPFYLHAKAQAFVCYKNGKAIGRVAAIKDDLHNEHYGDKVGFFGFLECPNDQSVCDSLINSVRDWLMAVGCDQMRGPVNPSMKSDFGVLLEGHEVPPFIMMGHTHQYYDELFRNSGFEVVKRFFALKFEPENDLGNVKDRWARYKRTVTRALKRYPQLKLRSVDKDNYVDTLRDINRLGNRVRSTNYGFVPMTEPELEFMISQLKRIVRFDLICAAYWTDEQGKEDIVGFVVNVPDLNWCLKRTIGKWDWLRMLQLPYLMKRTKRTRVIALGVHEGFRKKGVAAALIQHLIDRYDEYEEWEMSWVVEDNLKSLGIIGSAITYDTYKTYHLYQKPL